MIQISTHCPKCTNCPMLKKYGKPNFCPEMAIEGDPKSPIWIVGLNPKTDKPSNDINEYNPMTWTSTDEAAPHFLRLEKIIGHDWHKKLFKNNGIAHTDIVKCGSPSFTETEKSSVSHCKCFLFNQINRHKPKLLLVLSSDASKAIQEAAEISKDETEGEWFYEKNKTNSCHIIFSGYSAPRQERFARLRLKKDFLSACHRLGLKA